MTRPLSPADGDHHGFSAAAADLGARFGDSFTVDAEHLDRHTGVASWLAPQRPQAVVYARDADDVRDVLRTCRRHGVAVIPYGGGTSIEGQLNAPLGGVCLDLSTMDRVVRVSADNLTATVQPGLRREKLNEVLRPHGVFFPVDPGADATIGGMSATRASGTRAVGYGTMRDNVARARVMLVSGEEIEVGTEAVKSAAGYDLLSLFIGSEGTLGVFTELTVRVQPIPEHVCAGSAVFGSVAAAVRAVTALRPRQHGVTRIELLDRASVRAVNDYSALGLPDAVHLFFELSGVRAAVDAEVDRLTRIFTAHSAVAVRATADPDEGVRLWQARHDLWWATHAAFPDRVGLPTDVCVPPARLAECIEFAIEQADRAGLAAPLCGHVGDGNFHTLVMVDPAAPAAVSSARDYAEALARHAIALGGTCTGEHGVGQGKRHLMPVEHGPAHRIMAQLKLSLDPQRTLNPTKIVDTAEGGFPRND